MTTTPTTTADQLLKMPRGVYRYELVKGKLIKMPPAGKPHGVLAMRIGWRLARYVEDHSLGQVCAAETGFRLASNPDTVRAPDAAFISRERLETEGEVAGFWPGAPDLAVEVVSPGDTNTEVEDKVFEWLRAGTRMVVVINPRQETVTVYRSLEEVVVLNRDDVLDGGEVVPGWTLPVHELFG